MGKKRVLICSIPCWNSKTGSDTFSSLMEGYDPDCIANLYIREDLPDSPVCHNYFRISESAVIKSIFRRNVKTGKHILTNNKKLNSDENINNALQTQRRYQKYKTKRNIFMLWVREFVWMLGKWKTPELKKFVDDFSTDVVFFAMEGSIHFNRICRYVLKRSKAKGIGYFWDDNFTYKQSKNPMFFVYRFFQRNDIKKSVKACSKFFAIAPKTKREADSVFNINCELLTKPVDLRGRSYLPYKPNKPLRIVYTGKLIAGRYETIKLLGRALEQINVKEDKAFLYVYTTTPLSDIQKSDCGKYVRFMPAVLQTQISQIQSDADILLFAESVRKNELGARLSFSTKLTDYFKSGKCIFAIGNEDTAPIEYLKDNDAAVIASNKSETEKKLKLLIENPSLISVYGKNSFLCGKNNHEKSDIQNRLFSAFESD